MSLTILWYAISGHQPDDVTHHRKRHPSCLTKAAPSPADTLAKLRRVIISCQLHPATGCAPKPDQIAEVPTSMRSRRPLNCEARATIPVSVEPSAFQTWARCRVGRQPAVSAPTPGCCVDPTVHKSADLETGDAWARCCSARRSGSGHRVREVLADARMASLLASAQRVRPCVGSSKEQSADGTSRGCSRPGGGVSAGLKRGS